MHESKIRKWHEIFREALDETKISASEWELECYSRDSGSITPRAPAVVLQPRSRDEAAQVVLIAAKEGIPVVPRGGGTSMCGAPIPRVDGAAVLDLTFLRGVEVREQEGVAVAEAGASWTDVRARVLRKGFDLGLEGPWSAPAATLGGTLSVSAICMGAARHGTLGSQIAGLEACFPAYGVVRMGSWSNEGSLPVVAECNGPNAGHLLVGAHGTLGVILRTSLKIFPKVEEDALGFVLSNVQQATCLARELALGQLVYDCRIFVSPVPDPMSGGTGLVCMAKESRPHLERSLEEIKLLARSYGAREVPGFGWDYYSGRLNTRVKAFGTAGPGWLEVAGYLSFETYPHVAEKTVGFLRSQQSELEALGVRWSVGGLLESRSMNLPVALFCNEAKKDSWTGMLAIWEQMGHLMFGLGVSPYWIGHMASWLTPRTGPAADAFRGLKQAFDPKGVLNPEMLF